MKPLSPILTVASFACIGVASTAFGAVSFFEDFSDGTPGSFMSLGTGHGAATTDFTDAFTITSGPNTRIYLGTNDTDYSTVDFVFEADIIISSLGDWSISFFGMGHPDASSANFGEPVTGPNLLGLLWPRLERSNSKDNTTNASSVVQTEGLGPLVGGTHRARLSWNSSTGMGLFEFDINSNGTVESSFTLDGSDNGFDATNSRLIVGGGDGLAFDNISVVVIPEPSGLVLLTLACAATAPFARWRNCF